jgi:hypothetical protein
MTPYSKSSEKLIRFLCDFEFVRTQDEEGRIYFYEPIEIIAAGRTITTFIRYNRNLGEMISYFPEISERLIQGGSYSDTAIIKAFILIFGIAPKWQRNEILIEGFLRCFKTVKLKQFVFFHPQRAEKIYNLSFHDFSIGDLDFQKFKKFLKMHTGSDFADNFRSKLENKCGIEIKNHLVPLIDIYEWLRFIKIEFDNIGMFNQELINNYLTALSQHSYKEFKGKFYQQLQFIKAMYGVSYELEEFEKYGFSFINVYYNFMGDPKLGWVLPITGADYKMEFPDPRILKRINKFLDGNKEILKSSKGEFSYYLNTLSQLFANAEDQLDHLNFNHGFLGFFVGLDFLLAPGGEPSKKLKGRIALLTHVQSNLGFIDQVSVIDRFYSARNKFVHEGKDVDEGDLIKLRFICRLILNACLEVHRSNLELRTISYKNWISKIDELILLAEQNASISKSEWASIGVKNWQNVPFQTQIDRYEFHEQA